MIVAQITLIFYCLNHMFCVYSDKIKTSNLLYFLYFSSAPKSCYSHDIYHIVINNHIPAKVSLL